VPVEAVTRAGCQRPGLATGNARNNPDIAHRYLVRKAYPVLIRARGQGHVAFAADCRKLARKTRQQHPVICRRLYRSRGTFGTVNEAVASCPRCAGCYRVFCFDMPQAVWTDLGEDQEKIAQITGKYRFDLLCQAWKFVAQQDPGLDRHAAPLCRAVRLLVSLSFAPCPCSPTSG